MDIGTSPALGPTPPIPVIGRLATEIYYGGPDKRWVPGGLVRDLDRAGVTIRRYCDPEGLPMHAKFVLIDDGGNRSAWFGSLNYTVTSRYLNKEILARSTDTTVLDGQAIVHAAEQQAGPCAARPRAAAGQSARQREGRPGPAP